MTLRRRRRPDLAWGAFIPTTYDAFGMMRTFHRRRQRQALPLHRRRRALLGPWTTASTLNHPAETFALRDLGGQVLRLSTGPRTATPGPWQWLEDYVYRDGQLFAAVDSTGTHHFHLDHLGSPRLITNSAGSSSPTTSTTPSAKRPPPTTRTTSR